MEETATATGESPALMRRVERLEADNRRLRRGGVVLLAAIPLLAMLGGRAPAEGDVLEATEFRLVDDGGEVRASLAVVERRPQLRLYRDGVAVLRIDEDRVLLGSESEGPFFEVTPTGVRGAARWTDSDRGDADVGLFLPPDELAHGPLLSLGHADRGLVALGWDLHGDFLMLFQGRRVYFDRDGTVRWEPDPGR